MINAFNLIASRSNTIGKLLRHSQRQTAFNIGFVIAKQGLCVQACAVEAISSPSIRQCRATRLLRCPNANPKQATRNDKLVKEHGVGRNGSVPMQIGVADAFRFTRYSSEIASYLELTGRLLAVILFCFPILVHAQVPGSSIDVQHYTFALQLNDENNNIKGEATVEIKFLKDVNTFNLNLVKQNRAGKGMLVSAVKENGKAVQFAQDSDEININTTANVGSLHKFTVTYSGVPADGLIISTNKFGHRTFFGDNWPNRAHNWLPCVDDPADKATLDFMVTAPAHYQVVANGLKVEEKQIANNQKLTHWKETALLPPKVMVIGVAEFAIEKAGDPDGIPVYTYVFPENAAVGFKSYAVAKEILPFYISKFGPYAYQKLANVQSKTIFGGMENAGAIFYFENSVGDKGIEELMAHEIAHQWFGDAASEKTWQNLWLSEGFATYMTNYYLESKYGIDTLKKRLLTDRQTVFSFEKTRLTPVVDNTVKGNYMVLLNANSYQKGGWILHMLRRKLGDADFWKGIRNYYAKYNGSNANTDDLCTILEQASGKDLKPFFKEWLYTAGHPKLAINWKYDAVKGVVNVMVEQQQSNLYELPLEIAINGRTHTIPIKDKITAFVIPAGEKPVTIIPDPDVNLLASFTVTNN
jgi:aminopeptidase N